jgi:hypothetical protein
MLSLVDRELKDSEVDSESFSEKSKTTIRLVLVAKPDRQNERFSHSAMGYRPPAPDGLMQAGRRRGVAGISNGLLETSDRKAQLPESRGERRFKG